MRKKTDPPKGFTLLEVLVSLVILSATLVMAYRVTSGAIAASDRSEAQTMASLLGEEKFREETVSFPPIQETDGKFPDPHEGYAWKLTVRQAVHPDVREVHVSVSWERDGNVQTFTLSGVAVR
jgi:general secretion pathway protein I